MGRHEGATRGGVLQPAQAYERDDAARHITLEHSTTPLFSLGTKSAQWLGKTARFIIVIG